MSIKNELCVEIAYLAEKYLDLKKWGFQESMRLEKLDGTSVPSVIYNSDICKVKISFNEWNPPHQSKDYTVDVYYGRLNAPNDKNVFTNNNEKCYCWHGVIKALHFLDSRTPEYTVKNLFSHDLVREYSKSLSSETLPYKLPEWEIRKHAYVWEQYAPRLFELFDSRRTDLWEKYRLFLKGLYDIKGRNPNIVPPMDSVC